MTSKTKAKEKNLEKTVHFTLTGLSFMSSDKSRKLLQKPYRKMSKGHE